MKEWPGGYHIVMKIPQEFLVVNHSCKLDKNTYLRRSLGLLIWEGLELMKQLFLIYLVTLKQNYNVSIRPVLNHHMIGRYFSAYNAIKITTVCISLTHRYRNIGQYRVDILDLQLQWNWVWGLQNGRSYYVMEFHSKVSTRQFQ